MIKKDVYVPNVTEEDKKQEAKDRLAVKRLARELEKKRKKLSRE